MYFSIFLRDLIFCILALLILYYSFYFEDLYNNQYMNTKIDRLLIQK